jgi:hypothetical protein
MKEEVEFEEWWKTFLKEPFYEKMDGYEMSEYLIREIRIIPMDKRKAFLNELTNLCIQKQQGWQIACESLRSEAAQEQYDIAFKFVQNSITDNYDEEYINSLVSILANSTDVNHLKMIEELAIQSKTSYGWKIIVNSLFPNNAELFCKLWQKQIEEKDINILEGFVTYFVFRYKALVYLRDNCISKDLHKTWDKLKETIIYNIKRNRNNYSFTKESERKKIEEIIGIRIT